MNDELKALVPQVASLQTERDEAGSNLINRTVFACCGLLLLCMACTPAAAQNTPPHAASTQTWTFGGQTWSDAIHIPACNKSTYKDSNELPQCRSYTIYKGKTHYYYNWAYVNQHAAELCPPPWRMPAKEDAKTLVESTTYTVLTEAWGYGGYAHYKDVFNEKARAYFWTSTQSSNVLAYELLYNNESLYVSHAGKRYGHQVRCVK